MPFLLSLFFVVFKKVSTVKFTAPPGWILAVAVCISSVKVAICHCFISSAVATCTFLLMLLVRIYPGMALM